MEIGPHKLSWAISENGFDMMMDASASKAIALVDCDGTNSIDMVSIVDHSTKEVAYIFAQHGKTIVMIMDISNHDAKLWTARLLIEGDLYICHRVKGMQWEFTDKIGERKFVHLGSNKGGRTVDAKPEAE